MPVAPIETAPVPKALALPAAKVPLVKVVPPEKVLLPLRVIMPVLALTKAPLPAIVPFRLTALVPEKEIVPAL